MLLLSLSTLSGCDKQRIALVIRPCVVRGMAWTVDASGKTVTANGDTVVDAKVSDLMDQVNAIWTAGADIAFLLPVANSHNGHVPIIEDPFPPGTPGGAGSLGDIQQDQDGTESLETDAAVAACDAAWAADFPGAVQPGITVVFVRGFVRTDGHVNVSLAAFETPYFQTYTQARFAGRDLCVKPRTILPADVAHRWTLIQTAINSSNAPGFFGTVLAHELGHALLLRHGDGVDNDNNGVFDESCDQNEFNAFDLKASHDQLSLMYPTVFADVTTITALQRDLARTAAVQIAGELGGPP